MRRIRSFFLIWSVLVFSLMVNLFGCDSGNGEPLLQLPLDGPVAEDPALNRWVQAYFELRLEYLVSNDAGKCENLKASLETFFASKESFKATLKQLDEQKAIDAALGVDYLSGSVEARIGAKPNQRITDLLEVEAVTFATTPTMDVDSETGDPVIPARFQIFDITLAPANSQWAIVSEVETTPITSANSDTLGKIAEELMANWENEPLKNPGVGTVLKVQSYSYNRSTAARWAKDHSEKSLAMAAEPTYYYFTDNDGGDCTNFLSWCLYKGGWAQTANWHFYGTGGSCQNNNCSCNQMSCPRSPSWSKAYLFNEYITNRGQYAGVLGDNRVEKLFGPLRVPLHLTWVAHGVTGCNNQFVNEIKKLRIGDIVQIERGSSGNMKHSMIVTSTQSSKPWVKVTYHTPDTREEKIQSITGGSRLYGYRVKNSGF